MGDNIEDLVLPESTEEKKTKQKGLYVILGLVILLLIFGVILANMIFGGASDDNASVDTLKTEQAKVVDDKMADNGIAKKSDSADPDLAPLDDTANNDKKMEVIKADDEELMKPAKEEKSDKVAQESVAAPVAKVQPKPHPKPKPVVHHKPKPKPHPKPKHVVSYGGVGNTYIQVGSFSQGPNEAFINKIIRSGFKYRIKEVNGFRRVLVGPFRNKAEASRVLGTVKARISQSAFIK